MSNELLEKVIRTTEVGSGGGGLLNPEQSNRFIDYMWDATVLAGQVRTIRMRATEQEIERIGVGKRLIRRAVEAVDTGENQGVFFSKISMRTEKIRLDWELSTESLEDNLEGEALEDHIARLMATQAGNDLEDVAINGDTANTADPALRIMDGWRKRGLAGGSRVDHAGGGFDRSVANAAIRQMPREFMQRRNELKFFIGSNLIQDYLYNLTRDVNASTYANTTGRVVPDGPAGFNMGTIFGVPFQEVPLFEENRTYDADGAGTGAAVGDHGEVWLTFPKNLLWGVKREIKVVREYKAKKDTIEYTMFCRVGTAVENVDAFVVVTNIAVDGPVNADTLR